MNQSNNLLRRRYLSLAIASLFAVSGLASAQEADNKVQNNAAATDSNGEAPQEVTVTARRRAELQKDLPMAITAMSAEALRNNNVQNMADLAGHVPDLTVYAARGSNTTMTTFIRGIGQADPTWGADPGVGLYLDDVYIARPQGALLDVFDVQRIEVLRGPQGTLYGKNTIGGALKYVSRPLSAQTEGSVEVDLGSYAQKNVKASFGTASTDGEWRTRLALATLHHDGYGHNLTSGEPVSNQNTNAGRVSVGYFPNALPFTLQLSADNTRDNSNERGFQRMAVNKFDPAKTPVSDSRYDIASGMPDVNNTHASGVALTATYALNDDWMAKAISSRRHSDTNTTIDFDGLPATIADVYGDYHDQQSTQEVQLVYQGQGGASGVVGLYRFDGSAGGHIFNNFLGRQFAQTASTVYTTSNALYADWNFPFASRWNLSTGLRYTNEEKHAVVDNKVYSNASFTVPVAVAANFDKTLTTNNVAPKIALDFKATDDTNLYASLARGFKSGGFNIRANTTAVPASSHPYLDEEVTTFEVGSKSNFDNGKLQLNVALFNSSYKNMQLSVFTSYTLPNGSQGFFGDFTNAGKATVNGVEIESIWRPTRNWSISGNLSYLDTKFDEYISGGVNVANQKWFSNAPRVQAGLNVEYIVKPSSGGTLRSRVGYTYQSKVYPTTDLSEAIAQDAYGLVGAGIVWERDAHWTMSLQGSNLTDQRYRTDGYNIPALGILSGYYGPPRTITAAVSYKF